MTRNWYFRRRFTFLLPSLVATVGAADRLSGACFKTDPGAISLGQARALDNTTMLLIVVLLPACGFYPDS
jgi:hypothetical protein